MNSRELVSKTIKGKNPGPTPVYGWVRENMEDEIGEEFGSVERFEDHYHFDMAHLFGGPHPFRQEKFKELRKKGIEITPQVALEIPLNPVNKSDDYQSINADLNHYHKERKRFCYVQTPGIFESLNMIFGIENHLLYMGLYPEELTEIYFRQAKWNKQFADNMIDLGVDMIHISDDWGAQKSLLFSKKMWQDLIYPYHKIVCDSIKNRNCFLSLHSDGNINSVVDGIIDLGYDVVHPWQESAGMSYNIYKQEYADDIAIHGGLDVQQTIGFNDLKNLEQEIKRVFNLLRDSRWLFCTSHFVQKHCSIEELVFAFDLVVELARD